MATDSTPSDLSTPDVPADGPVPTERRLRSRRVARGLVIALLLGWAFVATGAADAAEHAISDAFPNSMMEGCGGG